MLQFIFFFALLALAFAEDAKKVEEKKSEDKAKPKRGLFELGYGFNDLTITAPGYASSVYAAAPAFSSYHLSEPSTHTHTVITKEVPVPYPQVVEKHVPYPVKVCSFFYIKFNLILPISLKQINIFHLYHFTSQLKNLISNQESIQFEEIPDQ